MRDTKRSQGHVLLGARASRGRKAARPDHRRRGQGSRGGVPRVRGPEDKDDAGEARHRGLEEAHLPNHDGERPGQRVLEEEAPAFRLEVEQGPAADPARQALRRARAPHPCRRRPDVRAHRAEVELRLPAGQPPPQPRDRRALGRRPARPRPGEGGVRHRGVPLSDIQVFHTASVEASSPTPR